MLIDPSPFGQPEIKYVDVAAERKGPRSAFEITFPQALQWALIGVAAAFALSIVTERTRGTLLRLRLAPISRAHILAGKGLACFTACVSVCALLMAIGVVVFGVRVVSWGGTDCGHWVGVVLFCRVDDDGQRDGENGAGSRWSRLGDVSGLFDDRWRYGATDGTTRLDGNLGECQPGQVVNPGHGGCDLAGVLGF